MAPETRFRPNLQRNLEKSAAATNSVPCVFQDHLDNASRHRRYNLTRHQRRRRTSRDNPATMQLAEREGKIAQQNQWRRYYCDTRQAQASRLQPQTIPLSCLTAIHLQRIVATHTLHAPAAEPHQALGTHQQYLARTESPPPLPQHEAPASAADASSLRRAIHAAAFLDAPETRPAGFPNQHPVESAPRQSQTPSQQSRARLSVSPNQHVAVPSRRGRQLSHEQHGDPGAHTLRSGPRARNTGPLPNASLYLRETPMQ